MMQQHFVKQTNRRFESRCCDGRSQLCCPIDNWKPWFFQILDKLRLALEILANWSCCVFTIVKFTLAHSAWSLLLSGFFQLQKTASVRELPLWITWLPRCGRSRTDAALWFERYIDSTALQNVSRIWAWSEVFLTFFKFWAFFVPK